MSSSSVNDHSSLTIDIRPLLEDVSQLMTKHISRMLEGVVGEYTTYKETHDIIMSLPCVQKLQSKVSYLEMQLQSNTHNNGHVDIIQEQTTNDRTQSQSSSSDYNEVLKLKLAIDELTKYIHQLESAQAPAKPAAASTPTTLKEEDAEEKCDIHDSETEAVRLEIRENDQSSNDDSDGSNNEDEDECDKNTKNEIVAVNIVRADEIIDGAEEDADAEEEEEVDAEEEEDAVDADEAEEDAVDADEAEEEEAEEEEEEAVDAEEEDAGAEEKVESEEEEEAEEEAVEDVDAEEEDDAAVEEDEIEVSEIKIKGKTYFTTNSKNGIIYACVNDDVGDEVGVFKNGIALFNTKK